MNVICPIRGHQHNLKVIQTHTQQGTGQRGLTWECPSGNYRWFSLEGREPTDATRMIKPRWGWKNP